MTGAAPRRALVTGAGGAIGRATAAALAAEGLAVVGAVRAAAEPLPGVGTVVGDLGDADGCRAVAEQAQAALGGVDVLVHCAGVDTNRERAIWEQPDDIWAPTMAVNALALYELARLLSGAMVERRWGRIVVVASTAGLTGGAAYAAYCASKHAAIGVIRAIALDLAPFGVTANAVAPGWVAPTAMSDAAFAAMAEREGTSAADVRDRLAAEQPAGRLVTPDDVAAAVAFLAGEPSAAINGEVLRVAGGSAW